MKGMIANKRLLEQGNLRILRWALGLMDLILKSYTSPLKKTTLQTYLPEKVVILPKKSKFLKQVKALNPGNKDSRLNFVQIAGMNYVGNL